MSFILFEKYLLAIKDIIYPARCEICGLDLKHQEKIICQKCYQKISFINPPFCPICCRPIQSPISDNQLCGSCRQKPQNLIVLAGAEYIEPLKGLIYNYKYCKSQYMSIFLADILEHNINFEKLMGETDILLPIPLHKSRLRWRGFNQARVLAKLIAKKYQKKLMGQGILVRSRNTPPQAKLDRSARCKNIKGAFEIKKPEKIDGQNITLVDDVYTTGSTAKECSKILYKAGAKKVSIIVVAR